MTEHETKLILLSVPIGADCAEGWRAIWQRLDCWEATTIGQKLAKLADDGLIERRKATTTTGFRWVYWRGRVVSGHGLHAPSTVLGAG